MNNQAPAESLRLDKWLWHARFFKTRTLAAKAVASSPVRINRQPVSKPSQSVRPGDVLTFAQARHIRVIEIVALGARRGPAPEARALYRDLDPPVSPARKDDKPPPLASREPGSGRPTKKERRDLDRLRDRNA